MLRRGSCRSDFSRSHKGTGRSAAADRNVRHRDRGHVETAFADRGARLRGPGVGVDHFPGRGQAAVAALVFVCRSEEHTSELQSLMRISYAVFCLKKKQQRKIA